MTLERDSNADANPFDDSHSISGISLDRPPSYSKTFKIGVILSPNSSSSKSPISTLNKKRDSFSLPPAGSAQETEILNLVEETCTDTEIDLKQFLYRLRDSKRNKDPCSFKDWTKDHSPTMLPQIKRKKKKFHYFRKFLSVFTDQIADGSQEDSKSSSLGRSYGDIPPPPAEHDKNDFLGLAIYYHERDQLGISSFYLRLSAEHDNHPIGYYLYAMSLRNGWGGGRKDPKAAFECFVKSVEAAIATIFGIGGKVLSQQALKRRNSGTSDSDVKEPKLKRDPSSAFNSMDRRSPRSLSEHQSVKSSSGLRIDAWQLYALTNTAEISEENINLIKVILPLPVYEISMSFRHGWGVPKCAEASIYYLSVAAGLGDPDACLSLADSYMKGLGIPRSKYNAAKYFRLAEKNGIKLVGESWVHKKKWGGDEPD
ncbi:hypothetical protein HK098_001142 [Nowakowskiella sp. JEL0407]|nr:hypothetical protein HK098_001142 [Nowakowskiella sp. JEL0407]